MRRRRRFAIALVLVLGVVFLAGCGTIAGGALGAGLGAAGAAAVGAPPAVGAKLGAIIGGGAGLLLYDVPRPMGYVEYYPNGGSATYYYPAPPPAPHRRPTPVCVGRLDQEYGYRPDPHGGPPFFEPTGRVFCRGEIIIR